MSPDKYGEATLPRLKTVKESANFQPEYSAIEKFCMARLAHCVEYSIILRSASKAQQDEL